ncbi:MAG TPA: HNH endonuclease [Frankiaceae bacterium]|jgi:putative restriction endonuclease|nr:HNH endonuclease [Frankiaceae bacterium]
MVLADRDSVLRAALFARLDLLVGQSPDGAVRSADVNTLSFEGRPFQVIGQQGIRRVAGLDAALSFTTVYRRPGAERPYEDEIGPNGMLEYRYRGTDPNHPDNRALREAMRRQAPLVYFEGVAPGVYVPHYPVYLVAEHPDRLAFSVAIDESQRFVDLQHQTPEQRRYVTRTTKQRLHQTTFRTRVLRAYDGTCAMCRLRHPELLDAAHILPDGHPQGQPITPNGLSLCKIHHAAYDKNIVGVRPDLVIEVRADILAEVDGPMLRHGLQEMEGGRLIVPRSRYDHPDQLRLEERYLRFREAS